MGEILGDLSASTVAAAIEANIAEQVRHLYAPSHQVRIYDDPDMLWITADVPHSYLNRVYQARFHPEDVERRIAQTLGYFSRRGLPFSWHVGTLSKPPDLGKHLAAHGLTREEDEVGMAADLLALDDTLSPPPRLVIGRVGETGTLRKWLGVVAVCFEYPHSVASVLYDLFKASGLGEDLPWRLYLGSVDETAVGASRLFLGGGVAGIYAVGTIPKKRSHGIGRAMTLVPLAEARRLGYRIGVLRGKEMALGIYRGLGFEEYCRFEIYSWER